MSDDLSTEFWNRAENITAGMLSTDKAAPRPMAHLCRKGSNALYFITAAGTDIADEAKNGASARHVLACSHGALYATIDGTLSMETDEKTLDDVWSPMAAAWFEEGREDDDIRLVRFAPREAEIWILDGAPKTLYEIAKANVTDQTPDLGTHGTIRF